MKKLILVVVLGLLAGCEYTVPLAKSPEIGIDKAILGLWQRTKDDGQVEQLCVLPLDPKEYLVSFPSGVTNSMFARACLCRVADKSLVQLEWVGSGEGKLLEDNRAFQFVTYSLAGDRLTVRLLNSEVVSKDVASTEELTKAFAANKDNANLFKEPMVFTKVKN
jgi:hypothetical protein